jgi:pyrophosphate--fructose-6-phosphate 1-phosphotransferase
VTLIGEEVAERNYSLSDIVDIICRAVASRAGKGVDHGVVLIPEGLIEFIPEMKRLIEELDAAMADFEKLFPGKHDLAGLKKFVLDNISPQSGHLFRSLPAEFADMLLLDRDPHGNVQVSQIPTEKLLIAMVTTRLKETKPNPGRVAEVKCDPAKSSDRDEGQIALKPEDEARCEKPEFPTNHHFFGYEGRCGAPSCFDAAYTFNLGIAAGSLALAGKTGYMVAIRNLNSGGEALALPLTGLICMERRHGKDELVIKKALVGTDSPAFEFFASRRDHWSREDCFASPGPRQLWGPTTAQLPMSVALNQGYPRLTFDFGKTNISCV